MLGAHVCTYLYCQLVSLGNALALQDAGTESTCEAIACSYCIGNLYLRSFLERLEAWSKDIAAVHTTGEHEHVEIVLTEDEPALVLDVKTRITEETTYGNQFLIVDLQDITTLQTLTDHLLGIEVLTQVDVENLQAVLGSIVEELIDRLAAYLVALSQRAPAYSSGIGSHLLDVVGEGDVVPCHTFLDVISRNTLCIELYLYGSCREVHTWHHILQLFLIQQAKRFITQYVFAHSTYGYRMQAMLTGMIGEIGRSATQLRTCRQNIEKDLAQTYTIFLIQIFYFHNLCFLIQVLQVQKFTSSPY